MAFTKFHLFVCQRAVILQREIIQGKPKNTRQLFCHEESIHEVSRRYLDAPYIHTYSQYKKKRNLFNDFLGGKKIDCNKDSILVAIQ